MDILLFLKALRDLGPQQTGLFAFYKLGLRLGLFRMTDRRPKTEDRPPSPVGGLVDLPSRESILSILGDEGRRTLLHEADEIVAGRVRLFGGEPVALDLSPRAPLAHWSDFETGRARVKGDIKLIWEPARFGWATVLARAFSVSGREKYAEAFWNYLGTFLATNPPYRGPNWISAQEVALRLIAWTFCLPLLREADSTTESRVRALGEAIAVHAERIPPTLVYARSQNNNHLLSEAAGLITAASLLPDHPRAKQWMSLGSKWFNHGLEKQIDGYGEYSQHSTNYHRVMLQLALWVNSLTTKEHKGFSFTPLARKNLVRASHWLASMLDSESGGVPNLGANDGAYILPLTVCPYADFRPVVQASARAFLDYELPGGVWDEMSLWFGLTRSGRSFEADHYLGDHLRGRESWAYLRTTSFTSRPGHADLLHFDLWWRGLNVTPDAGTFSYNAEPPWDNPLTATRVHNTVAVDGRDQMTRAGKFLYVDWANAYARSIIEPQENIFGKLRAHHKGYRRAGVEHERTISVYTDEAWLIEDRLLNWRGRPHVYRLHWLLPDWAWRIEENEADMILTMESPHGPIRLRVTSTARPLQVKLMRAGEVVFGPGEAAPFEGWSSPTYGQKIPALSLSVEVGSSSHALVASEFNFPK